MNRALRVRIEAIEKRVKPLEQGLVIVSFGETDEAFAARIKQARVDHPMHVLHEVRVKFA